MKWRANVTWCNPKVMHLLRGADLPMSKTTCVEVVQAKKGFEMHRFDAAGGACGDTWHPTLEEAKQQLKHEFALEDGALVRAD